MDLFNEILSELFNFKRSKMTEEKVEFTKGNYKTIVTMRFAENGQMEDVIIESKYIPSEEEIKENEKLLKIKELRTELVIALEQEDYNTCAKLKKEIDMLELNQQQ